MQVQFIVAPEEGRWALTRGSRFLCSFVDRDDALQAADRFAKAMARQENTSVKLRQGDGSLQNVTSYQREGFIC